MDKTCAPTQQAAIRWAMGVVRDAKEQGAPSYDARVALASGHTMRVSFRGNEPIKTKVTPGWPTRGHVFGGPKACKAL